MRALIDVPFLDAAAADLAWALERDAAAPAGLAHLDVLAGPCALRLHVLGASHAVELLLPGGRRVTETVACGIAGGRALGSAPARVDDHGVRYGFAADVQTPGTDAVVSLAAELHATLAADPHGIVAAFPGSPGAATGLRARVGTGEVAWDTWHLYPEQGEVVRTRTTVGLPTPADGTTDRAAGPPDAAHRAPAAERSSVDDRALAGTAGVAR